MRPLWKLTVTELKLFLREPAAVFFTLAFPLLLLWLNGGNGNRPRDELGGRGLMDVLAPGFVAMVLAEVGLTSLPGLLSSYRERGILRRLSTTPVQPASLLLAQLAMGLAMAAVAVALVLGIGVVAFDTAMPQQAVGFLAALVMTAAALYAVGFLVAAVAPSGKAASGIGTALFFPVMFFGGLWVPREAMPEVLRRIGDFTPLGAGVQALQDATAGAWPRPLHLAVLAAFAVVAGVAAAKLFRWE